jgi:hypothetical protein
MNYYRSKRTNLTSERPMQSKRPPVAAHFSNSEFVPFETSDSTDR